jgi:signal peptidase I
VDPERVKTATYPDQDPEGDIIVFSSTRASSELIVHRAIAKEERDGKWYFQTKGDGNSGPDSPQPSVPEDNVEGKVVMRIPWIGRVALFMRNSSGIYIIIILIIILVIVEFVVPIVSRGKPEVLQEEDEEIFEI